MPVFNNKFAEMSVSCGKSGKRLIGCMCQNTRKIVNTTLFDVCYTLTNIVQAFKEPNTELQITKLLDFILQRYVSYRYTTETRLTVHYFKTINTNHPLFIQ